MATASDKNKVDARWQAQGPKLLESTIVVATERSQLSHIEISMNALASECDSAGFFQWQQLYRQIDVSQLISEKKGR